MNRYKKYMVWIMVFSFSVLYIRPVMAQQAVIDNGRNGSVTIQKYIAEKPEDYGLPATGEEQPPEGLRTLGNISFTVTRVQDDDTSPVTAVPVTGSGEYSRTLATDEHGLAEFKDLALGVYLIHEEESPAVEAPVEDFLVSVPMTNPSGTGWLYDIFVYPKNELAGKPDIDLSVVSRNNRYTPVDLGSTVTWIAGTDIPGDIMTAELYKIEGTLDQYLSFQEGGERIYYNTDGGSPVTLEKDSDYEIEIKGQVFSLTLLKKGREKLSGEAGNLLMTELITTFEVPEEQAAEMLAQEVSMAVSLHYTNELGLPSISEPEQGAAIYTGGLNLLKTDARSGDGLEGAVFQIYRSMEDARKGENPVLSPAGNAEWQAVTDGSGTAGFYGLAYGEQGEPPGEGTRTYYLTEVKAPSGYNLLRAPEEVVVNSVSHQQGNYYEIKNRAGFVLPLTGGMGTVLFTVTGLAVIFAAWMLYKKVNRRTDEV